MWDEVLRKHLRVVNAGNFSTWAWRLENLEFKDSLGSGELEVNLAI